MVEERRMHKSLLISHIYFPPQVGGISHFMARIASTLGPERVCCLTAAAMQSQARRETLQPRVYRRPAAFTRSACLQALCLGTSITEIMFRERPQIIQLATVDEGYLGLWLNWCLKLPFVIYAHGNEILAAMQTEWEKPRLALQQAACVLANSRFTKDLVQQLGVAPEKIEIVHPGCDTDQFRPLAPRLDVRRKLLGQRDRAQVILTVGNLVARKGHDMVIRALPLLRRSLPDVTYLIVGDGPYREQLETLAVAMGVHDCVIFANRVPDEDLPDIYAMSDVFIMPSRARIEACDVEGFGLVFLEANACGKPVIGGRSGGIPDAIIDGHTGFLVDPYDPQDIANTLARLLTDRDLSSQLGRQGQARVVRDFSWTQVVDRVQRILDSILRQSPHVPNITPKNKPAHQAISS
jgi:phosphatidyl-myo-inositol dimannoside synthase